ncbi:hypothetical protein NESM_000578200 [Novymonas esmeraldas]|uniref:Uncharacterized protein n=1 Tax=Novymonas esmeraldas TaxID=1808958 RepID=A0AAW0EQM1_9TRYP
MLKCSVALLRRGKPRPRAGMFPDKYRRVPTLLKPQQGGQQHFNTFLIRSSNDALEAQQQQERQQRLQGGGAERVSTDATSTITGGGGAGGEWGSAHPRLPQADVDGTRHRSSAEAIAAEMQQLAAHDGVTAQRGFNERLWYEQEQRRMRGGGGGDGDGAAVARSSDTAAEAQPGVLPERILGDEYFASKFGFSLLKGQPQDAAMADDGVRAYAQLDLWGEMPKYNRDFVFLYLVSRRRNTYAVAYDYGGRRLLTTYTAGNRGLKGGDRGFRGDGSTDNGHQVTSMYLADLLPKIREARAAAGRPLGRGEKVDLVVRVMGFYNGRQGAVRAVQDRSVDYRVRYLEDVTPFPLNGPKMPRGVFR